MKRRASTDPLEAEPEPKRPAPTQKLSETTYQFLKSLLETAIRYACSHCFLPHLPSSQELSKVHLDDKTKSHFALLKKKYLRLSPSFLTFSGSSKSFELWSIHRPRSLTMKFCMKKINKLNNSFWINKMNSNDYKKKWNNNKSSYLFTILKELTCQIAC